MANFNEHALEMSIMGLFKDEGYTYVSDDQIHRERTEVLLTDDQKQYLYNRYAKDGITPSEVDSVILMLRNISSTIYEATFVVQVRNSLMKIRIISIFIVLSVLSFSS
jgi:type I restriction enzyme, R subunit